MFGDTVRQKQPRGADATSAVPFPVCLTIIVAFFALGAALRFYGLSARDFWFDESCTFTYVHNLFTWPANSNLLVETTNLPYYVILRGWTGWFGPSEAAYRSLSAVAATLTVPVLAIAAARIRNRLTGLVCAALAALHPLHIYYAHEARAYAVWVLLLALLLWLLIEAARSNLWRWWAAFGTALLAALLTHYFTAYFAAGSVAAVALSRDRHATLRRWSATMAVAAIAFAPYFCFAVLPAAKGGGSVWIDPTFRPLTAIPHTLWAFMPAGSYPSHLRGLSLASPDTVIRQPTSLVVASQVVPAVLIAAVGFVVLRRRFQSPSRHAATGVGRSHLFLGALTLGPLLLAVAYSIFIRPVYLAGRYDMVAWPASIVWLSVTLADFAADQEGSPRWRRLAAVMAPLLALSLVPIHRIVSFAPPASFHRVRAERLAELAAPGDFVIALAYDRDYLGYYLNRAKFQGEIRSFPSWLEQQVGWVDTAADLRRLPEAQGDARKIASEAQRRLLAGNRVLLLADSTDPKGEGARQPIHAQVLESFLERGLSVRSADASMLIYDIASARPIDPS